MGKVVQLIHSGTKQSRILNKDRALIIGKLLQIQSYFSNTNTRVIPEISAHIIYSISISYLLNKPAIPVKENFALLIRFTSGSIVKL